MTNKKDVLMIDSDTRFIIEMEKLLQDNFNCLSTDNLETAFSYCGMSPLKLEQPQNPIFEPYMIVFGDDIKVSNRFINSIKNNIPQIHNEEAFDTFLPVYYSKLFSEYLKQTGRPAPSTCICIDSSSYTLSGEHTQDITKVLSYCLQNNIPLIKKSDDKEKMTLNALTELINRKCGIKGTRR